MSQQRSTVLLLIYAGYQVHHFLIWQSIPGPFFVYQKWVHEWEQTYSALLTN